MLGRLGTIPLYAKCTNAVTPLKVWRARRKVREIELRYDKKILTAEQAYDFDWAADLKINCAEETADLANLCYKYDCDKYLRKAKRLGVSIHDLRQFPFPLGRSTHAHEQIEDTLHWCSFHALKAMVEDAKKEKRLRWQETLKAISPIISGVCALIGAIVGAIITSLFKR